MPRLHACFGKELESLKDPFWLEFDATASRIGEYQAVKILITNVCGGDNKYSDAMMKMLGTLSTPQIFAKLGQITEKFATDKKNNVRQEDLQNENIKLFNDYIEDYTASSDGKYGKKQLLADMGAMFFGETDTVLYLFAIFCTFKG